MADTTFKDQIVAALSDATDGAPDFEPNASRKGNAANALTELICHRLASAGAELSKIAHRTYAWSGGQINIRNYITDQRVMWTDMTGDYANRIHREQEGADFVFTLSYWDPGDSEAHVWAVPEPVVYDSIQRLPKKSKDRTDLKIPCDEHVFRNDPQPVDLKPYYARLKLNPQELAMMNAAAATDDAVRADRAEEPESQLEAGDDIDAVDTLGFLNLMRRYQQRGTVFRSREKGAIYAIASVSDTGCQVARLTASDPAPLTASYFEDKIARLQTNNGRTPVAELGNNTAIAMAMLQAPGTGISVDRTVAMWFESDDEAIDHLCRLVEHLEVNAQGGESKLYKPALLAAVIDGIEEGQLTENRFELDDLLPSVQKQHIDLGRDPVSREQVAQGFFYLTSELFWFLSYGDSPHRVLEGVDAVRRQPRDGETPIEASLHETYWRALQDPRARHHVMDALAAKWWPQIEPSDSPPNYWWVNQGQAYIAQRKLGILWAPQRNVRNHKLNHYTNVSKVRTGDVVFHCRSGEIVAVSIATSDGQDMDQPQELRDAVEGWAKQGWAVDVEIHELDAPIALGAVAPQIHALNLDHSPINVRHNPNEGYLFALDGAATQIIAAQLDEHDLPDEIRCRLPGSGGRTKKVNPMPPEDFKLSDALAALRRYVAGQGFTYEPWQLACFVTALRTKPFVILAGVTGTGKSKLPKLVGQGTGGVTRLVPVRPDWTDSADILGYVDLEGRFRAGQFLEFARKANDASDQLHVCIIDEMNLGRVEHYFAEVLSRIEDREAAANGGFRSGGLLGMDLQPEDQAWRGQGIGPNLAIVGTVNMDESAHGFSRKVLDRAFTIELSEIDLGVIEAAGEAAASSMARWPVSAWHPLAIRLGALPEAEREQHADTIESTIGVLQKLNAILVHAQLQLGYRSRDEIVLFVLHAKDLADHFATRSGNKVDPFDLAVMMKVLPRIVGGSGAIQRVLDDLLRWAGSIGNGEDLDAYVSAWDEDGRPNAIEGASLPRCAARLCLMRERLHEGYTSFWL